MNKFKSIYFALELVLILFIINALCYSQTEVSGDIRTSTTWTYINSPYEITGDINIREGAVLTIENGVTINCQNRYLFVGLYQSAKIVADGVDFNNGTIKFNKESSGSIINSNFNKTKLYLEDYSFPNISQNMFDENSPIFMHSPDAIPNFQNNQFSDGKIFISCDIDYDRTLVHFENCTYHLDNDIFIISAILSINKFTTINLHRNSIYVGNYSDAQFNVSQVNINNGWIRFSDNSIGELTNNNISQISFTLKDAAKLTISHSNLDTTSIITNNSSLSVEAANNYWGRPEGPIMNDSVAVIKGDVNYLPFSPVPLKTTTSIIESKTINDSPELFQNYPNPFNPKTIISYKLPVVSVIKLSIFNLVGQKMVTIVSEKQQAGNYRIEWDANGFASGIYFYRLETDREFVQSKKLVLLK